MRSHRRVLYLLLLAFSAYYFLPRLSVSKHDTLIPNEEDIDFDAGRDEVEITELPHSSSPSTPSVPTPTDETKPDLNARHVYLPNGLLQVNPNASHPILELIRDAETKWQKKLNRASKTLGEAVAEYKRRYKRSPPRGFDKWYVFGHLFRQ